MQRQRATDAALSTFIATGHPMNFKRFFSPSTRSLNLSAACAFTALAALHAGVANAASDNGTATATVVTPIAIENTAGLAFGKFSAGSGGTVVMNTAGARSKTGGVVLLSGTAGSAAAFDVTGDGSATYAITLPGSATVTHTDTVTNMSIGTFASNPSATGTLSAGAQTVNVGATLTVASAQTAGSYSGTFTVSVEYN